MTIWGRVIDNQVFQEIDIDPTTLFTPEECVFWQELPEGVTVGSIFFEDRWWTGAEYLDEMQKRNPPAPEEPPALSNPLGAVLEIEIVETGQNYVPISETTGQYDSETGKQLVLTIKVNETGAVSEVVIRATGNGYQVGDAFEYRDNYDISWNRINPTYAKFKVVKVQE